MASPTEILQVLLEKVAKDNKFSNCNVKIEPVTSGGANFTSQLYLTKISNGTELGKDLNIFAKVAIIGEKIRSQGLENIFETEAYLYTKLSKIYRQLEEKHKVPKELRLEFPKFYGHSPTRGQEVLLLEDLTSQGYSPYDRRKPIDWPYAFKAIKELAKFHALSFAFQEEHPEEFDKTLKTFAYSEGNNENIQNFVFSALETAYSVTEENNKRRLQDFFTNSNMADFMGYMKPLRRTALIHGDYRVSNLMHKVDDEGIYQLKVLDYQTIRSSSPVIDLMYFIFTATDEEFRAKSYFPLIDHYYSQLSLAMRRLGLKPKEIYSREDFDYELKMKLSCGILIAIMVLPVVLVEEEDAPKMDKDTDTTAFKMDKTGKLYPERLNGIINDYVRWRVL